MRVLGRWIKNGKGYRWTARRQPHYTGSSGQRPPAPQISRPRPPARSGDSRGPHVTSAASPSARSARQRHEGHSSRSPSMSAPAPEPSQSPARGRRRTTASAVSANLFGRHHFDLDTVEVIFEHLEPRVLTTLLRLSKSWYAVRARMHISLRKQFLGLDKRVRAGFKPLPPPSIIQTYSGPVWPDECSCQSRCTIRGNVDPTSASLPQLAAAVTTLQRALSMKSVQLHIRTLTGRRYSFQALSLGQESALSCITVGDVHQLVEWREGGALLSAGAVTPQSLVMFEASRFIQMRHLDAPLITYLREEESRLEYSLPVCRAHWCCAARSKARWNQPTVGSLQVDSEAAANFPGFLRELPGSVARRIQEAGLPLPTSRFVLTDDFIVWAGSKHSEFLRGSI